MRLRHDYLNQTTCIWFTTQKTRRIKLPKQNISFAHWWKTISHAYLPAWLVIVRPPSVRASPRPNHYFEQPAFVGRAPSAELLPLNWSILSQKVIISTLKNHHFSPKKWWQGDENCRRKIKHESENGICQAKSKERTPCFYSGTPAAPSKNSGKNTDCLPTISYFCAQTCRLISPTTLKKNHYG